MIKILLAEDHHIVRKGIKLLLAEDQEMNVVAEASNGLEVLNLLENNADIDVLVTDLNMPVMDGETLLKEIQRKYTGVKVIVLSMLDDTNVIARLVQMGASGYLYKNAEATELIFAIKFVAEGSRYISSELSIEMLQTLNSNNNKVQLQRNTDFSSRELQVLQLIAEGFTNSEIAEKIFVSKRTVEGHRQSLLEKTGSKNTALLIRNATFLQLI